MNPQIMQALQMLRANPMQFLLQRKINVPQDLMGNPQAIVQHLLNSGQMSQDVYNRIQAQANKFFK